MDEKEIIERNNKLSEEVVRLEAELNKEIGNRRISPEDTRGLEYAIALFEKMRYVDKEDVILKWKPGPRKHSVSTEHPYGIYQHSELDVVIVWLKELYDIKCAEKEKEDNRTMADLAKEALDVQDASNLSGVVHSFSRAITRLRQLLEVEAEERKKQRDTAPYCELSSHPVCMLWADKIASMTRGDRYAVASYGNESAWTKAYKWAKEQCKSSDTTTRR